MMHHSWRYELFTVCALLIISTLTGCANTGHGQIIHKPEQLTTNNTTTNFTSLPEEGRGFFLGMLSVDSNWKENPDTDDIIFSLSYTGESVSFVYQLGSESTPGGEQLGLRLYLNGVPQPFTVGEANGITACEKPVEEYYFDAQRNQTYCIPISFTPVCGHDGDTLPLFVMFTPSPNYEVTKISECNQGGWMKSIAAPPYPLYMKADAPEQHTVDADNVDTGVLSEGEDGRFVIRHFINSRARKEIEDKYENPDNALIEAGYGNNYDVCIFKLEENNKLNVMLTGITSCTPLYRFQLRLDGKAVPLFNGKYYGDARLPNTANKTDTLVSLDFDLSDYPNARTVQLLMIPLPQGGYTWQEASARICEIHATRVGWIRYDGDAK